MTADDAAAESCLGCCRLEAGLPVQTAFYDSKEGACLFISFLLHLRAAFSSSLCACPFIPHCLVMNFRPSFQHFALCARDLFRRRALVSFAREPIFALNTWTSRRRENRCCGVNMPTLRSHISCLRIKHCTNERKMSIAAAEIEKSCCR